MIPLDEHHDALLAKITAVHLNEVEKRVKALELAIRAGDELLALHLTYRATEQLNKIAAKSAGIAD